MKKHILAALLLGSIFASSDVLAEGRRKNDLPEAPAVRHRRLLVSGRFEATPLFESTINAEFQHIIGGGLKLEYHLGDMISIGGIGVFAKNINTKLVDRIVPTLENMENDATREPSQAEFEQHLNSMPLHGAGYISLTPWYGKLAAFSQAYVAFDFYFQAGVSFAQLKSDCAVCNDPAPGQSRPGGPNGEMLPPDNNPNNDPPLNDGSRLGLYLGGGIHVYLNDFLALDLTVRDYLFNDNPSGLDYDANLYVDKDDERFLNHLFMGLGVSFFLPSEVKRTE
jgi:outer membrane beta-barrel protein